MPAAWPARRLEEVDETATELSSAKGDALSMRVLGRLQWLAAELDRERRRDRLTQAARTFSTGMLSARGDDLAFAQVCSQALDLDLAPNGDFIEAQRFLAGVRSELSRRFGIQVNLDRPELARHQIAERSAGAR